MNRKDEILKVKELGEAIGYGNMMDIASALWGLKSGVPCHVPAVKGYLTSEGQAVIMPEVELRMEEIKKLGIS